MLRTVIGALRSFLSHLTFSLFLFGFTAFETANVSYESMALMCFFTNILARVIRFQSTTNESNETILKIKFMTMLPHRGIRDRITMNLYSNSGEKYIFGKYISSSIDISLNVLIFIISITHLKSNHTIVIY